MKIGNGKRKNRSSERQALIRTSPKFFLCLLVAGFLCTGGAKTSAADAIMTVTGRTMGTSFTVKIVTPERTTRQLTKESVEADINERLLQVNLQMSTYMKQSELSKFNRYQGTDWFPVSADLANVLQQAIKTSELSHGAFDMTVGPLVNLWGFGPENRPTKIPSDRDIETRKALIGYENVAVRLNPPAVKKSQPGIYCDLSAIAKGFGVDKVADYLEKSGIDNYMVEIGGEVRTRGHNSTGIAWRIGVESPDNPSGIEKVLLISDKAIATSGDYFNYFEENGVRYSHTIDPRTGRPITHKLASVTVVHTSCMVADAFATAIDVLGPEKGFDFAVQQNLPVFMLIRHEGQFVEKMTPNFRELLATN